MNCLGMSVLRFTNHEVLGSIDSVIRAIRERLGLKWLRRACYCFVPSEQVIQLNPRVSPFPKVSTPHREAIGGRIQERDSAFGGPRNESCLGDARLASIRLSENAMFWRRKC